MKSYAKDFENIVDNDDDPYMLRTAVAFISEKMTRHKKKSKEKDGCSSIKITYDEFDTYSGICDIDEVKEKNQQRTKCVSKINTIAKGGVPSNGFVLFFKMNVFQKQYEEVPGVFSVVELPSQLAVYTMKELRKIENFYNRVFYDIGITAGDNGYYEIDSSEKRAFKGRNLRLAKVMKSKMGTEKHYQVLGMLTYLHKSGQRNIEQFKDNMQMTNDMFSVLSNDSQ